MQKRKNVGIYAIDFSVKVINELGEDVTDNYKFVYPTGSRIEITTRTILVTTASKTINYDGNDLTCEQYTVTGDQLASGDTLSLVFVGKQVGLGECDNLVDVTKTKITNLNNEDVTKNYVINYKYGKLEITFPL